MGIMNYLKFTFVLKRYLWILVLLITIVPIISSGVQESKETGDWSILFNKLGEGLVTVDNTIGEKIEDKNYEFEKFKDTEDKVNKTFEFFKDLFLELWKYVALYLALIYGLIQGIKQLNTENHWSKPIKSVFWTTIILAVFFILGKGTPFRGLWTLIKTFWEFFGCF